jgi:Tfp pilus assembly protein PilF
MAPPKLRMRLWVGVWALALGAGCATPMATTSAVPSGPSWLNAGMAQGLPMEYPLQLSPSTEVRIRHEVSLYAGSKNGELRRLQRFLIDGDGLGFKYRPTRTLNAQAAFDAREGDCMSYAVLYVAAARSLGLEIHFVRITQLPVFWESNGRFFTSSHIAVASGYDTWTENALVVDFSATQNGDWRFALYEPIDDELAFVLFHNNRAVELLLNEKPAEAEHLLRYLVENAPAAPEVYNNLGTVLMHEKRYQEATELYGQAIERFPHFIPFYSNAVLAASASGLPDLVHYWTTVGRKLAKSDPAFSFAEGMLAFKQGDFSSAAQHFVDALEVQPDDLTLLAWTARAHLHAGDLNHGRKDVERIQQQTPSDAQRSLLSALKAEFPAAGIELPPPAVVPPLSPPAAQT